MCLISESATRAAAAATDHQRHTRTRGDNEIESAVAGDITEEIDEAVPVEVAGGAPSKHRS